MSAPCIVNFRTVIQETSWVSSSHPQGILWVCRFGNRHYVPSSSHPSMIFPPFSGPCCNYLSILMTKEWIRILEHIFHDHLQRNRASHCDVYTQIAVDGLWYFGSTFKENGLTQWLEFSLVNQPLSDVELDWMNRIHIKPKWAYLISYALHLKWGWKL